MNKNSFGVLLLFIIVALLIILKIWDQSGRKEEKRIRYDHVIRDPKP